MKSHIMRRIRVAALVLAFAVVCSVSALAAEVRVGTVVASSLNMRSDSSTSSSITGNAANGSKVVVLSQSGDWCKVVFNQTQGYMHADYLKMSSSGEFSIGSGVISGSSVNFRKSPSLSGGIITQLHMNKSLKILGVENGWYKVEVDGKVGYVHPDYVTITKPTATNDTVKTTAVDDAEVPKAETKSSASSDKDELRASIVAYAKQFLGCSYRYGTANGKTFDCSGFTSYVYQKFGYSLNRSAAGQVSNGTKVASKAELKPGDIVLFRDPKVNKGAASHVGMYVGDGKFIHCSSGGGCVKYNYLSDSYYSRYYIGARRIV